MEIETQTIHKNKDPEDWHKYKPIAGKNYVESLQELRIRKNRHRRLEKKIHGLGFRAQHPRRNASLNEERDKCNLTDKGKGIMIARGG